MDIEKNIIMNLEDIKAIIPHRAPLLLIDAVHELELHKRVVASKLLTGEEPVFAGHFPGNPVFPGVYFVEAIAQTGAVLLFKSNPETIGSLGLLAGVEEARFRRPGRPGDKIRFEVTIDKSRGMFHWFSGKAYINDEVVAQARISVALTK